MPYCQLRYASTGAIRSIGHNPGVPAFLRGLRALPVLAVVLLTAQAAGARFEADDDGTRQVGGRAPPNVLIVVTDDQRADPGSMKVLRATRKLIGDQGQRMTRAFTAVPLCCPARASIMTGQYPHNHNVLTNPQSSRLDQQDTIQYYLSQHGYSTAIFGKYLNEWKTDPPYFDTWAYPESEENPRYYNEDWNVDGQWRKVAQYSTDFISDKAVTHLASLELQDNKPWFTYLAPIAPHIPGTPAGRHQKAKVPVFDGNPAFFERNLRDKPPYVRTLEKPKLEEVRKLSTKQRRSLLAVDELVARVDETLEQLGEKENTLVFFMSDNGHNWGDHRLFGLGALKDTPYTPAVKIPFLMRWPAKVTPEVERRLVSNVDVAPTIYDAVGVTPEHRLDGHSLLDDSWTRRFILIEHFRKASGARVPGWASIRSKGAQYIETYTNDGERTFSELYDLERDPWQLRNLLRSPPAERDQVRRLRKKLQFATGCAGNEGANPCP